MALETWYTAEDLRRILRAVLLAAQESGASGEYAHGYVACATAIALAFGIEPHQVGGYVETRPTDVRLQDG